MKNVNSQRIRTPLLRGAKALALSSVLLAIVSCAHGKADTDNFSSRAEVTTYCTTTTIPTTTTSMVTTLTETTTTSTSTVTETTTMTTTTEAVTTTTAVETATESIVVTEIEPVTVDSNESDVILLAQLINQEASQTYEGKLMVASCVVNRMNVKGLSLQDVIYAPQQFSTVDLLGYYTDSDYQAAYQVLNEGSVDSRLYFFDGNHPDHKNHFRDVNQNYVGAW